MVKRLALKEYEESAPQQLTIEERDSLTGLVRDLTITPVRGSEGWYMLRPGSYIGTVDLGTLVVTIEPKLPISRVLFLLSYGLDRFKWQPREPELLHASGVFEAVAQAFAAHVAHATRRGLLHGYREVEETLPVVRGRLRLGEQISRRFGRMPPIDIAYDDYTHDIDENMLLCAALTCLGRLQVRSHETTKALRRTAATLREVEPKQYSPRQLPAIRYTRLNRHYQSAVELAKLILRSISFEVEHGSISVRGFLLNMDDVFEDFVYSALHEALGLSQQEFIRKAKGKGFYLDAERSVSLQPDLSWWDGKCCRFVGDVKYKTAGKTAPNADLYQALSYAIAADLPGALLIYAAREFDFSSYQVLHAGKTLDVTAIDLTVPPGDILIRIAEIAHRIRTTSDLWLQAS